MISCLDSLPLIKSFGDSQDKSVLVLHTDGRLFKKLDDTIFTYRGVTAFKLPRLYADGINIDSFLTRFSRSNVLRVFPYTPEKEWGSKYWDIPETHSFIDFCNYIAGFGFYVEVTLGTDNDNAKVQPLKDLIRALSGVDNVLFEACNEPYVKGADDKLDPNIFKNLLSGSGNVYSSGIYDWNNRDKFYGKYMTIHSDRNDEWPRKTNSAEDYRDLGNFPVVQDEPIRPDQAAYNLLDYYTYGAGSTLFGNGATFHYLNGEFGLLPSDQEFACYSAMMDGMDIFPAGACLGSYSHRKDLEDIDSSGEPQAALRVFQKGKYGLIIRNKHVQIPSNWKPLDDKNVCFEIL